MNFNYDPDRPGLTLLPDQIDEATASCIISVVSKPSDALGNMPDHHVHQQKDSAGEQE